MSLSRRRLLVGAALAAAGVVVAGFVRFRTALTRDAVEVIVYKRLSSLELDPEGVRAFAQAYVDKALVEAKHTRTWQMLRVAGPFWRHVPLSVLGPYATQLAAVEERVAQSYLLSCSYFLPGGDRGPVRYLSLYDPEKPCRNPFARFD